MLTNTKYGYVTGTFKPDKDKDILFPVYQLDKDGNTVTLKGIKTVRVIEDKNVDMIGDSAAFIQHRDKYGRITDDE